MYLIYCEKIPSDCEIARYLLDDHSAGSFCVVAKRQENASCKCFISDNSLAVIGWCRIGDRGFSLQFGCREYCLCPDSPARYEGWRKAVRRLLALWGRFLHRIEDGAFGQSPECVCGLLGCPRWVASSQAFLSWWFQYNSTFARINISRANVIAFYC